MYDKQVGLNRKATSLLNTATTLTMEDLDDALNIIKKNFHFPRKTSILELVEKGSIIVVFNTTSERLPDSIPCFLTKSANGGIIGVVNITNQATMTREGKLNVDARKLYMYLQTAYLYMNIYTRFFAFEKDYYIPDETANLYAHLFVKVLNKMTNISIDKIKYDQVLFLVKKFCLINLFEKPNDDSVTTKALNISKYTGYELVKQAELNFVDDDFKSLESFIDKLKTIRGLGDLTVRGFLENYISMYGPSTILGIEFLPYFYHTIFTVTVGCHINNMYNIESVIEKTVDKLYNRVFEKCV